MEKNESKYLVLPKGVVQTTPMKNTLLLLSLYL